MDGRPPSPCRSLNGLLSNLKCFFAGGCRAAISLAVHPTTTFAVACSCLVLFLFVTLSLCLLTPPVWLLRPCWTGAGA